METQDPLDRREDPEGYSRRELLRRGLVAGGSVAAGSVILSSVAAGTAAAAVPVTPPSVTVGLAPLWPWGAAVDTNAPYYLSPDPGPLGGGSDGTQSGFGVPVGSGFPVPPNGERSGIRAPFLVVPLLVTVGLGRPPALRLPFDVHIVATGNGLLADTVQIDVPFSKKDHTLTKTWFGIFPVLLRPRSLQLQATIPAAGQATASTFEVAGDFGQAPLASSLAQGEQASLVGAIAAQSEGEIGEMFAAVNTAAELAAIQLSSIHANHSAVSIGDMFEMQMLFNNINQLTETSTSVISAVNGAIQSMARNIKG